MHEHGRQNRPTRYVVHADDGRVGLHHDLEGVLADLAGRYGSSLWDALVRHDDGRGGYRPRARVESVDGAPVPVEALGAGPATWWVGPARAGRFAFRDGPVPGVGRGTGRGWLRHPRHRGEHAGREAGRRDLREEGLPVVAGRGAHLGPPTHRDDVRRGVERCWKGQRRTKWREVRP